MIAVNSKSGWAEIGSPTCQRRHVPEQHPPRAALGEAQLPSLRVIVWIGREGRGQRGAVAKLAGVDVDRGAAHLARGEIAADLDDVAAGFRPGGGEAAGEDAGPGGAPDLFGIEGGQAGGGGDCFHRATVAIAVWAPPSGGLA